MAFGEGFSQDAHRNYMQSNVEIALLDRAVPWPADITKATAEAVSIPAKQWYRYGSGHFGLLSHQECTQIANFACKTPFGERWFHVWEGHYRNDFPERPYWIAVVKPRNIGNLIVTCTLNPSGQEMIADYALLSGRRLGKHSVPFRAGNITMKHFEKPARALAFKEMLLESRTQSLQLVVDGFGHPLPSRICLWSKLAISDLQGEAMNDKVLAHRLNTWTSYLRTLTFNDLDDLAQVCSADRFNRVLHLKPAMTCQEYVEKHRKRSRSRDRLSETGDSISDETTTDELGSD